MGGGSFRGMFSDPRSLPCRFLTSTPPDRDDRFPPRQALPFPDNPPYTAHVGNLSFDVTEAQISEFFAVCDVDHVRLVRDKTDDRPKGFGYVEFKTKEGLIAAVDLNGTQFCGRNVRISVAEPRITPHDLPSDSR